MHGIGLAFLPGPRSAMKGDDPEALPPLGEKITPGKPPTVPLAPLWRRLPAHPGYETDGASIRRIAGS